MQIREHKGLLTLGGAVLFLLGGALGGLLVNRIYSPTFVPPDLPISERLAEAHRLLDKSELAQAEKIYRSILSQDPGNAEAITHLGNVAAQRGDLEAALRHYDEALGHDPDYIHALWDKALALRDKGDPVGAIQAWEAFARLVPPDSQDAATVKKFIAESQAQLAAQMGIAPAAAKTQ